MYVRACYVELATMLLLEGGAQQQIPLSPPLLALILGPKGIGKTMFLNYLIVRIVEKERLAGTLDTLSIAYLFNSSSTASSAGEVVRFTAQGVSSVSGTVGGFADYYLSDSIDVSYAGLGKKLLLEVSSENQGNYKRFNDRLLEKNGKRIAMDVWSLEELLHVKRPEWKNGEVEFLYMVFGGRVRHVLGGDLAAVETMDVIEDTARWYFGPTVKAAYPQSWNRALQSIRLAIADAEGKTTNKELAITTSLFWVVCSGAPGGQQRESGFSSTFLKLIAGQMRNLRDSSLWNELNKLIGGLEKASASKPSDT